MCSGSAKQTHKHVTVFAGKNETLSNFYPTGWAGGQREEVCTACISETISCRKLILGRDIG